MAIKYFAYGSNMLTQRLNARVSSANNPKGCRLFGYKLRFNKKSSDGSGKCNIIKTNSNSDVVHGVIFDIEDSQIPILDSWEGVRFGYKQKPITILVNSLKTKAFTYIAENHAIDETLIPFSWYHDLVITGAKQHSLPNDYLAGLKSVPFMIDPEIKRKSRLEALKALKEYNKMSAP